MKTDVERIAEVLANHPNWHADAGDLELVMCRLCDWTKRVSLVDRKGAESAFRAHQAERLAAAGFGHVPTALHQAADAWDEGAEAAWDRSTPEVNGARYHWRSHGDPANPYRARADRAGGTA